MRRILLSAISLMLLAACHDDISESVVPEYEVRFSCNMTTINAALQQTHQPNLDTPGGYVRITERRNLSDVIGVGGLLLLQSFDNQFYAFDLACPYCFSSSENGGKIRRIDVADDGMKAHCEACDSEFSAIFWGSPAPTAGPANTEKLILRQYKVRRSGDGQTVVVSR